MIVEIFFAVPDRAAERQVEYDVGAAVAQDVQNRLPQQAISKFTHGRDEFQKSFHASGNVLGGITRRGHKQGGPSSDIIEKIACADQ